jgi:DNA-binding LacI/PurR family transcriptional regulator
MTKKEKSSTAPKRATEPVRRPKIQSISDFAKYLDLSAWTVSRAINGHPEVTEKTRRRIMEAMEEVGFRPNPLARGLGGRRTGMIGVCLFNLENPIISAKVYHLQDFLRRQRLRSMLEVTLRDPESELRVIEDFVRIRVDGIVLMYSSLDAATLTAQLDGMPCVVVDPHFPQKTPNISLDRRKAMRLLLEHLLRLEHRSFALLGFNKTDPWRWPALAETARDHGLDVERAFRFADMPAVDSQIEAGQLMAEKVLKWPDRPTAMITVDDRMAIGAIQALREAGVEVPRHMSVTGFDHIELARKLHPTLTTIEQNPAILMQRAGQILLEQIALPAA